MIKLNKIIKNFSTSSSEVLVNLFSGKLKADELLCKSYIIKSMKIGLSFLNKDNKSTFLDEIFKGENKHSAIYFNLENKDNQRTGVLVQYGQYKFIERDAISEGLKKNINNIGFPYGKGGGLMFGELEFSKFIENFGSAGIIRPRIDKKSGVQMTLNTFFNKVKKINGPWDYKSYEFLSKNCNSFVVAALKVLDIDYSPYEDKDDLDDDNIPIVIKDELEKHIIKE